MHFIYHGGKSRDLVLIRLPESAITSSSTPYVPVALRPQILTLTANRSVNIIREPSSNYIESENQEVRLQPPPCNRMASRKRRRLVEKAGIKETPPSSNCPPFFYPKTNHLARPNRWSLYHSDALTHFHRRIMSRSASCLGFQKGVTHVSYEAPRSLRLPQVSLARLCTHGAASVVPRTLRTNIGRACAAVSERVCESNICKRLQRWGFQANPCGCESSNQPP